MEGFLRIVCAFFKNLECLEDFAQRRVGIFGYLFLPSDPNAPARKQHHHDCHDLIPVLFPARIEESTGPLVRMMQQIAADIVPFLALLALTSLGWAIAFFSLRGDANAPDGDSYLDTIHTLVLVVLAGSDVGDLGMGSNWPSFTAGAQPLLQVLLVFTTLVLFFRAGGDVIIG